MGSGLDRLDEITKNSRIKHFPKGQIIFYEHDTPAETYLIKSGAVKIYDINESGNEKILHIISSPGLLPFSIYSGDNHPLNWFYSTLTDSEVYVLQKNKLYKELLKDSLLLMQVMNSFSLELHEMLIRLSSLGKTSAHEKVKACLLFLASKHASQRKNNWFRVNFSVNHQLLADMAGITRESASVVMKELSDLKVIRNPKMSTLEIDASKLSKSLNYSK